MLHESGRFILPTVVVILRQPQDARLTIMYCTAVS